MRDSVIITILRTRGRLPSALLTSEDVFFHHPKEVFYD